MRSARNISARRRFSLASGNMSKVTQHLVLARARLLYLEAAARIRPGLSLDAFLERILRDLVLAH
jgi:hypothetical protein